MQMIEIQHTLAIFVVIAGAFFMLVGSIGIVRLPDFFSRTHATSKSDTLGIMLVLGGLALYEGASLNSVKLVIAIVFVALAYPVGAHALAKAAFRHGLKPWFRTDREKEQTGKTPEV